MSDLGDRLVGYACLFIAGYLTAVLVLENYGLCL